MGMGLSEKVARYALEKTDNNFDRALEYIFSHENIEDEIMIAESE